MESGTDAGPEAGTYSAEIYTYSSDILLAPTDNSTLIRNRKTSKPKNGKIIAFLICFALILGTSAVFKEKLDALARKVKPSIKGKCEIMAKAHRPSGKALSTGVFKENYWVKFNKEDHELRTGNEDRMVDENDAENSSITAFLFEHISKLDEISEDLRIISDRVIRNLSDMFHSLFAADKLKSNWKEQAFQHAKRNSNEEYERVTSILSRLEKNSTLPCTTHGLLQRADNVQAAARSLSQLRFAIFGIGGPLSEIGPYLLSCSDVTQTLLRKVSKEMTDYLKFCHDDLLDIQTRAETEIKEFLLKCKGLGEVNDPQGYSDNDIGQSKNKRLEGK